MSPVQKRLKVPVRLVSPMFIRWQMDAYYALKADLEELGLGPFLCPTAVSSGIHGVLMAAALCQRARQPHAPAAARRARAAAGRRA